MQQRHHPGCHGNRVALPAIGGRLKIKRCDEGPGAGERGLEMEEAGWLGRKAT